MWFCGQALILSCLNGVALPYPRFKKLCSLAALKGAPGEIHSLLDGVRKPVHVDSESRVQAYRVSLGVVVRAPQEHLLELRVTSQAMS